MTDEPPELPIGQKSPARQEPAQRDLIDAIKLAWDRHAAAMLIPPEGDARTALRRTFYVGALTTLQMLYAVETAGQTDPKAAARLFDSLQAELVQFTEDVDAGRA